MAPNGQTTDSPAHTCFSTDTGVGVGVGAGVWGEDSGTIVALGEPSEAVLAFKLQIGKVRRSTFHFPMRGD